MSIELSLVQPPLYQPRSQSQARQKRLTVAMPAANDIIGDAVSTKDQPTFSATTLALVLLAHALAFFLILTYSKIENPEVKVNDAAPMMVSLVAEPAPDPVPEVVEIIPEPKPKPVVKKQKPVQKVVEPTPIPVPVEVAPAPVIAESEPEVVQESAPPPVAVAAVREQPVVKEAPLPVIEEVVEPPKFGAAYLHNPPPPYPALSRRLGEEGRVMLRVLVAKSGDADAVEVEASSGSSRLDKAAQDAVKKWKFIPAKRNNQPINAYVLVPIQFTLNS